MENDHANTLREYLSFGELWGSPGFGFHLQTSSTTLKVSLHVVLCCSVTPAFVLPCDVYAFERMALSPCVDSSDAFLVF